MDGRSSTIGLAAVLAALAIPALPAGPAAAQEEPIGPCSPYRAADGDIPSEMPGCGRRRRFEAGSLEDELRFRRSRVAAMAANDGTAPDDEASPRRKPRRPPRHTPERPR